MPSFRTVAVTGLRLLIPCGLPLALLPLLFRAAADGGAWASFLGIYPILALSLAAVMALRLLRLRLLLVTVMIVAAERVLASGRAEPATAVAVAGFLAVNFVVIAWSRERGMVSVTSFLWLVALMTEAAMTLWLRLPENAQIAARLTSTLVPFQFSIGLPHIALAAVAAAGVALSSRFFARRAPIDAGLVWALLAATMAVVARGESERIVQAYFASALVAVVIAAFEQSLAFAYRDELTGLPGRRALEEAFDRLGGDYAIAMLDIDHFKRLNDRHGHVVGDQVLRMVAARLGAGPTKVYRYGGEEFAVIWRGADRAGAGRLADELRKRVAGSKFGVRAPGRPTKAPRGGAARTVDASSIRVTISAGFAVQADGESSREVVARADRALYKAKQNGRNRVEGG